MAPPFHHTTTSAFQPTSHQSPTAISSLSSNETTHHPHPSTTQPPFTLQGSMARRCPPETLVTWCRVFGQTVMSATPFEGSRPPTQRQVTRRRSCGAMSASGGEAREESACSNALLLPSPQPPLASLSQHFTVAFAPSSSASSSSSSPFHLNLPSSARATSSSPSKTTRRRSGGTFRSLGVHRSTSSSASSSAAAAADEGLWVMWRCAAEEEEAPRVPPPPQRVMVREARVEGAAGGVWVFRETTAASSTSPSSSTVDAWPASHAVLRARALALLWVLFGERRMRALGFPSAPVDALLWRCVRACCAAPAPTPRPPAPAAPRPLPPEHACGGDIVCFREHAHRLLEVCAPTRALWKSFGWTGLTVEAVFHRVYAQDVLPVLRANPPPPAVRLAMALLDAVEAEVASVAEAALRRSLAAAASAFSSSSASPPASSAGSPLSNAGFDAAVSTDDASPSVVTTVDTTPTTPTSPLGKRRRGRPAKSPLTHDEGRVERVMLWRFLLDLLEEAEDEEEAAGRAGGDGGGAPRCVRWVRREEGLFRVTNSEWLARLWGRRHGNPLMTYEKMSRAMRTYYRSKVLQPVPRAPNLPRKLLYKFNPAVLERVAASKAEAAAAAETKTAGGGGDAPHSPQRRRLESTSAAPSRSEASVPSPVTEDGEETSTTLFSSSE